MKGTGRTIELMDTDNMFTLTVMFTSASGLMIKLMEKVSTFILTEPNTMAIGLKINNKGTVNKNGSMAPNTMANTPMARKMEKESLHGLMAAVTKVPLKAII